MGNCIPYIVFFIIIYSFPDNRAILANACQWKGPRGVIEHHKDLIHMTLCESFQKENMLKFRRELFFIHLMKIILKNNFHEMN